jgi:hypothetical protein
LISKEKSSTPAPENTRPISVLPVITKIFEQAIISNIEKVAFNGWISNFQKGFYPGRSVFDNLEEVLSESNRIRDLPRSILVFIDLARAYDNVNRYKLMQILEDMGLPGNLLLLLKNMYLKTCLTIDGKNYIHSKKGLLQGSSLSPLLFDIYVDPLLRRLHSRT